MRQMQCFGRYQSRISENIGRDFTWNLQIHYLNPVDGGTKILYVGEVTREEKKRIRDKRRNELTYKDIRENREVLAYLKKGNDNLGTMGHDPGKIWIQRA